MHTQVRRVLGVRLLGPVLKIVEKGWPRVPRHVVAGGRNVVAAECTHRDELHIGQTQARDGGLQVRLDGFEDVLAVVDAVEFVDHNGNSRDLHERADVQVAQGLRPDSPGGVDQHEPDVGSRGGNRHVARVLLVARSVGDYESAAVAQVHRTVGDVNRDALFAFCLESVG